MWRGEGVDAFVVKLLPNHVEKEKELVVHQKGGGGDGGGGGGRRGRGWCRVQWFW